MTLTIRRALRLSLAALTLLPAAALAQGTRADYDRALALRERYDRAAVNIAGAVTWIENTHAFWYRRSIAGGFEFVRVDADTREKRPLFDHAKIAASLSQGANKPYTAVALPFNTLTFRDGEKTFEVTVDNATWQCTTAESACKKNEPQAARPGGPFACAAPTPADRPRVSPDGKSEAFVQNYNLVVKRVGDAKATPLSFDGSEGNCYQLSSIVWSPDSRRIAAYRVKPGYRRMVTYVESSPEDQLQPKTSSRFYAKPGDVLDFEQPMIFEVESKKQTVVPTDLFPNPYDVTPLVWRRDNTAVTFEYNQRGHQVYRVIEADATSGRTRVVISEEPKTFFNYRSSNGGLSDSGKKYRFDIADGREVIWMSERDGWNHLYLYDGVTGAVKNQITKGDWVVRGVQKVDEARRQIWFSAGGMDAGKDPYFAHYFRIDFDGSGMVRLTTADANHTAVYSSDMQFFVSTASRVDQAPLVELRRADDGGVVAEIERGDITELTRVGWRAPEVFVAKGRDGKTDIWGVVYRPSNLDPARKYPVLENIYAGPQGSFVPKNFAAYNGMQAQAELGFIVVQIDGMGTSNRSKAFHDVAWQNLGDAGFPDRILWHKAFAAKNPWYDITRVGLYGTSAGGQNSLGGLLFHPEFYKAAVSAAGCHDNRMDKIWWNEQWMGWPLGQQYSASSNVDNAHRLQGKVLLVVGEMDNNVDPSSTMQVVDRLIKANKTFDLLYIPGAGHTNGGPYGERKRFDFFVQHLLGKTPPAWNEAATPTTTSSGQE
jgi:dipeptidyl aminopeptidase/acylaminoacyl peptidase